MTWNCITAPQPRRAAKLGTVGAAYETIVRLSIMRPRRLISLSLAILACVGTNLLTDIAGVRSCQSYAIADTIDTWGIYIDTTLVFRGPNSAPGESLVLNQLLNGRVLGVVYRTDSGKELGGTIYVFSANATRRREITKAIIKKLGSPVRFPLHELRSSIRKDDHLVFSIRFKRGNHHDLKDFLEVR